MEVRPKVNVRIFDDTAAKEVLFGPSDAAAERSLAAYREMSSGKLEKLVLDGYFTLPVGKVAAIKGFFIKSTENLDIKLNGGAEVIQLRKPLKSGSVASPTLADYLVCYLDSEVTAIAVEAPTNPALVIFALWGDPAAS